MEKDYMDSSLDDIGLHKLDIFYFPLKIL